MWDPQIPRIEQTKNALRSFVFWSLQYWLRLFLEHLLSIVVKCVCSPKVTWELILKGCHKVLTDTAARTEIVILIDVDIDHPLLL